MNHKFGKLSNNVLTYAPDAVIVTEHHHEEWIDPETGEKHTEDWDTQRGCCPPTAADYLACDSGPWKAIVTAAPSDPAPSGSHYEPDGWAEDATTITRKWKVVADPVIPRKWTRLKLKTAIAQAGWLPQIKTMLGGIEIAPSYTALEAFTDCDYVEEFWPDATTWGNLLDTVAANLGKTRAEIDAFLAAIPTEG